MRRTRRCRPQQLGQGRKCDQADRRLGNQSGLIGADRSIKHPGRNLQPTIPVRPGQRAAESNAICSRDRLMNGDLKPTPGMPRIQQLPKYGPVGVLKPCSNACPAPIEWSGQNVSAASALPAAVNRLGRDCRAASAYPARQLQARAAGSPRQSVGARCERVARRRPVASPGGSA